MPRSVPQLSPSDPFSRGLLSRFPSLKCCAMLPTMTSSPNPGRGAANNPPNRFEKIEFEPDADWNPEENPLPRTTFLKDHSSTVITYNNSPDVGFEASSNPYR